MNKESRTDNKEMLEKFNERVATLKIDMKKAIQPDYALLEANAIIAASDKIHELERELAEARKQLEDFEVEATNAINDIARVKHQRDTLAEALDRFDVDWTLGDGDETSITLTYEDQQILRKAMAAAKGVSHD